MVSFSRVVKEEVVFNDFESCCQRAMLCAVIKINGVLSLSNSGLSLTIRTENAKIASKIHKMLKEEYDPQIEFLVSRKMKLKKNNVYILRVTKAREILDDLSLLQGLGFSQIPNPKIIKKDCFIINPNEENIKAKNIIIATGSKAAPKTGSDGLGYELAKSLGHNIITPLPSLVQLKADEPYFKNWSGIRTDVKVNLLINHTYIKSETGEIQLTNYGVSGICIFNISGEAAKALNQNKNVIISINFIPFASNPKTFLQTLNKNSYHKTISELLEGILHYKLIDIILKKAHLKRDLLLTTLTDKELNNLIKTLTDFQIKILDTHTLDHAQVCSGGIPLTEINSKTLESLKVKNLYFTGEIIDIDGDCGGYNLGWAWMSGIIAGKNVK